MCIYVYVSVKESLLQSKEEHSWGVIVDSSQRDRHADPHSKQITFLRFSYEIN